MPKARSVARVFPKSIAPSLSAELGVSFLMARTHGNEIVQLVLGSEGFERLANAAPEPKLDAELTVRLAHFMLFLAEVEDCTGALRNDEIEKVIEAAVAASGFPDAKQARQALEWVFRRPQELS
jgi:hypothetical protein